ncbi:MAG: DUF1294 domain-containing protein [Clostridia bacterium]
MKILIIYILVINLISFITMYLDKKLSINKKRRISEKTLFSLSLILGAFRHKTKHTKFIILIPIIFILNILTVYYIINYLI